LIILLQIKTLAQDKETCEKKINEFEATKARFKTQLDSLKAAHEAQLRVKDREINSLNAQLKHADMKLREKDNQQSSSSSSRRPPARSDSAVSDHIYETISEREYDDSVFAMPASSRMPARRESTRLPPASSSSSLHSSHTYASVGLPRASTSGASLRSRVSNASSLTLPCADELGEVLTEKEIDQFGFGKGSVEHIGMSARGGGGGRSVVDDVEGRISEIQRRNSMVPSHLRSCYPTELPVVARATEKELKVS
jgi:hypothetical protein